MGQARALRQAKRRARRLIAAANEMLAIAREIELEFSRDEAGRSQLDDLPVEEPVGDSALWGELARQAYKDRRRRRAVFNADVLFGEPAWDMLLDLFIAAKEGLRVSITSACIAADVPSTTALRWISVLEKEGLVVREEDQGDARRSFVRLSAAAYSAMVKYFQGSSITLSNKDWGSPSEPPWPPRQPYPDKAT